MDVNTAHIRADAETWLDICWAVFYANRDIADCEAMMAPSLLDSISRDETNWISEWNTLQTTIVDFAKGSESVYQRGVYDTEVLERHGTGPAVLSPGFSEVLVAIANLYDRTENDACVTFDAAREEAMNLDSSWYYAHP